MADKSTDKEALKEAEKAAKKAKAERIKKSKPKKEGNVVTRSSAAVKKFFKDFAGTCKKIVWPSGKTVIKNSLVVLASIIVIGLAVGLIDLGLTKLFDLGKTGITTLAENKSNDEDETTTAASDSLIDNIADLISDATTEAESESDEAEETSDEAEDETESVEETAEVTEESEA